MGAPSPSDDLDRILATADESIARLKPHAPVEPGAERHGPNDGVPQDSRARELLWLAVKWNVSTVIGQFSGGLLGVGLAGETGVYIGINLGGIVMPALVVLTGSRLMRVLSALFIGSVITALGLTVGPLAALLGGLIAALVPSTLGIGEPHLGAMAIHPRWARAMTWMFLAGLQALFSWQAIPW